MPDNSLAHGRLTLKSSNNKSGFRLKLHEHLADSWIAAEMHDTDLLISDHSLLGRMVSEVTKPFKINRIPTLENCDAPDQCLIEYFVEFETEKDMIASAFKIKYEK